VMGRKALGKWSYALMMQLLFYSSNAVTLTLTALVSRAPDPSEADAGASYFFGARLPTKRATRARPFTVRWAVCANRRTPSAASASP